MEVPPQMVQRESWCHWFYETVGCGCWRLRASQSACKLTFAAPGNVELSSFPDMFDTHSFVIIDNFFKCTGSNKIFLGWMASVYVRPSSEKDSQLTRRVRADLWKIYCILIFCLFSQKVVSVDPVLPFSLAKTSPGLLLQFSSSSPQWVPLLSSLRPSGSSSQCVSLFHSWTSIWLLIFPLRTLSS